MTEADTETAQDSPSPKVQAIRALRAAGFCLIPLRGKNPYIKEWTQIRPGRYGEAELAPQGINYGVSLRAGNLVVDIDPRNFEKGDTPVARLIADIGQSLSTFTIKTGNDGYHLYFWKSPDIRVRNSLKAYPGIEFKSVGRQVVGPGSIHPDTGKPYFIKLGSPDNIAEAPASLLALIERPPQEDFESNEGTGAYKDDDQTQKLFVAYLATAPTSGSYLVACHGRDFALPPTRTWELMVKHWNQRRNVPRSDEELKAKVLHAYRYASSPVGTAHPAASFKPIAAEKKEEAPKWDLNAQNQPLKTFNNLLIFLAHPGAGLNKVFGQNEFTGQVEIVNPAPWHNGRMPPYKVVGDRDLKLLKGHLTTNHGFEATVSAIEEAIVNNANTNKFHPVREYLDSLEWDKVERLDNWLRDFCGADDTEYVRACARKTLCAAVMRVMRPGCKFDHVLVLEGEQGIGKTGIVLILAGPWAGDFSIDPHSKDTIQLMQGKWIIELAELEVTRRTERDALKAFLTRQTDQARLAYGRMVNEFPRQSLFIATKNPDADGTYLHDDTGNRRWWPVKLKPKGPYIDFQGLKGARNQLFAEAMVRVKAQGGEKLYMDTSKLRELAEQAVGLRHAEHPYTEAIASYLTTIPQDRLFLTAREVYKDALGGQDRQLDRRITVAIAGVMRGLDWKQGVKRLGVERRVSRGYMRGPNAPRCVDPDNVLGSLL